MDSQNIRDSYLKLHQNKEGNILNHIYYLQTIKADDPFTLLTIVLVLVIWKRIYTYCDSIEKKSFDDKI